MVLAKSTVKVRVIVIWLRPFETTLYTVETILLSTYCESSLLVLLPLPLLGLEAHVSCSDLGEILVEFPLLKFVLVGCSANHT